MNITNKSETITETVAMNDYFREFLKELFEKAKKSEVSEINIFKSSEIKVATPLTTKDAKKIHDKVTSKISSYFRFSATNGILNLYSELVKTKKTSYKIFDDLKRESKDQTRLAVKIPSRLTNWRLPYSAIVVTEDDDCLIQLKKTKINSELIVSQNSLESLKSYDIVRAISCDKLSPSLEQMGNCFFIDKISETWPQTNLSMLDQWKETLTSLENCPLTYFDQNKEYQDAYFELKLLIPLLDAKKEEKKDYDKLPGIIEEINKVIATKIKELSISGEELLLAISKNKLPVEIEKVISKLVDDAGIDKTTINLAFPITIDEDELTKKVNTAESMSCYNIENRIMKNITEINRIPDNLKKVEIAILIDDFVKGINKYKQEYEAGFSSTNNNDYLNMINSKNILLDNPQAITFFLDKNSRGSILTGANSGGKTTLIEHIIQLISLKSLGLPISGDVSLPDYQYVYYFSKNKGSTNKGAFETLMTQLTQIKASEKTLILADELEAVTEPSVAANIIRSTLSYFTSKGCQAVFASHLGGVLEHELPKNIRIDGIEAKGLDENSNLIVDHNPVIGKLAKSTPELILLRLAKKKNNPYLQSLVRELGICA